MSGFIRIETDRLILRDHYESDIATHHKLFSDKMVMRYLQDIMTNSVEESQENLMGAIAQISDKDRSLYFLRIEEKSGAHVGEIGLTVLDTLPVGRVAQLGYFTHKEFWGRGYVTEAAQAMMDYGFNNGVYKVVTGCNLNNGGSQKVMIKCGMKKEAHFRDFGWQEGALYDRVEYAMLKNEWEKLRRE